MSTLVMIVANEGGSYYPGDLATAERLFGRLVDESGASGILTLRTDSYDESPDGIKELVTKRGISEECVQIDRLDPSSWLGNEDQNEIWNDQLETLICNSTLSSEDRDCIFLMNTGSNWNAALIYSLYESLGGSLWVTEGEKSSPILMDRRIPDEGSLGEAALASIAAFGIDNPKSMPITSDLQGLVEGVPTGKGFEKSLRGFKEYLTEDVGSNVKEYGLNPLGRYNAILSLAQKWEPLSVQGGRRGLVIFVRSTNESEAIRRYLKEHPTDFDKFAFVVGGINVTNEKEVSISIHEEAAGHLEPDQVASVPDEVCFNIPADQGVLESSVDVMEILQRIRQTNSGIEWSIDITGVLGLLRPAIYQFAHLAGIRSFFRARKHTVGSSISRAELGNYKRFLALPNISQIGSIRSFVIESNLEYRRFVATVYHFRRKNSGSEMGIEKSFLDCRPYNFNMGEFPSGHPLRMKEIVNENSQLKAMKRHLKKAEEGGLLFRDGKAVHLTPEGAVAGALIKG